MTDRSELPELCKTHTAKDLANLYGVAGKTITTWCQQMGCSPAYLCGTCKTKKPREECFSDRRCKECEEGLNNGTLDIPRVCGNCGIEKSTQDFYWQPRKHSIGVQSWCKECTSARWEARQEDDSEVVDWELAKNIPATPGPFNYYWNHYGHALALRGSEVHPDAAQGEAA